MENIYDNQAEVLEHESTRYSRKGKKEKYKRRKALGRSTVNRRGMVWIVGGAKKYVIVLCFGESRD